MRKLVLLALAALLAWRYLGRRRRHEPTVTLGWADGSSLVLDGDAVDRDRFVAIAARVIGP